MDRITKSVLTEFCAARQGLEQLPEDKQFEHLAAFVTVRRHHARTFATTDIVVGEGDDTGIDAVAIIVNGALITDIDSIAELVERNGQLEASFIFVQADRGAGFCSHKIGSFGFGVEDFFREVPTLSRGRGIAEAAAIAKAIFDRANHFRNKPLCRLYYVTTGVWQDDQNLRARRDGCVAALEASQLFDTPVEFTCIGADQLHRLYNQTKMAIKREFSFKDRAEIPAIDGVEQAFLGIIPAKEFLNVISDDSGDDILGSIFDLNVRDWQDYNAVNNEIRGTLKSDKRGRFALMNNGVTIITRSLRQLGSKFSIEDFSIVNGCQTSHVVFGEREEDLSTVLIPLRLIVTQDEDVIESIVRATNSQTELKPEQLYALTNFSRKLEALFSSYNEQYRLYYERRDGQYDRLPKIETTRIVIPQSLIRAFAAMFLDDPTRATKNYKSIRSLVGETIFKEGHRIEPYYVAAYAAWRLEWMFRNNKMDSIYKAARHHILMTLRYLMSPAPLPAMNARQMEFRCDEMIRVLWDTAAIDAKLLEAAAVVREVVGKPFDRDNVRTEHTKEALLKRFKGAKA